MHALNLNRSAWAVGRTIAECDLVKYGVHVRKIKRGSEGIQTPALTEVLHDNDILVISGKPRRVERAERHILDGH